MLVNKVSKPPNLICCEILSLVLRVSVKHKYFFTVDEIIDNPNAASLTSSLSLPPNLPKTAGAMHEISRFWIDDESRLKLCVGIIVNKVNNLVGEDVSLIECHALTLLCVNDAQKQVPFLFWRSSNTRGPFSLSRSCHCCLRVW